MVGKAIINPRFQGRGPDGSWRGFHNRVAAVIRRLTHETGGKREIENERKEEEKKPPLKN